MERSRTVESYNTMIGKLVLLFVVVIFQTKADVGNRYFIVDSYGLVSSSAYNPNSIREGRRPYRFQDYFKAHSYQVQRVKIQLYYECMCPDCRVFDSGEFKDTVLALGPYLDINVYPYGNAQTEERDGHVEFTCQHGPLECYGNKLHACAIDFFKNITEAVLFNSCLMDSSHAGKGSDDLAADVCANAIGIDSNPIKKCAKGDRGTALLKYYGVESKKANFKYVPYILIDGVENSGENFKQDVCKAFRNPPPTCNGLIH